MPQPSVTKISLKITYLKFHSNFPGANELKEVNIVVCCKEACCLDAISRTTVLAPCHFDGFVQDCSNSSALAMEFDCNLALRHWFSLCNTCEDWAPIDFIYRFLIFKLVTVTWHKDKAPGISPSNDHQGDMPYYKIWIDLKWCSITCPANIFSTGERVNTQRAEQIDHQR